MLAGRVGGVAMNGGSLHKVPLALGESRTLDWVLQTIVRSLAEYSEVAAARVWLASTLIVKSASNSSIRMSNMHAR
jgi:hypothetical protein